MDDKFECFERYGTFGAGGSRIQMGLQMEIKAHKVAIGTIDKEGIHGSDILPIPRSLWNRFITSRALKLTSP